MTNTFPSLSAQREAILQVATRGHCAQTRADKITPYIEHPKTVDARVARKLQRLISGDQPLPGRLWLASGMRIWAQEPLRLIAHGAALCHDLREDWPGFDYVAQLEATKLFETATIARIDKIVRALTNTSGDYLDYLLRLRALRIDYTPVSLLAEDADRRADFENAVITLLVKQADMEANLIDTESIPSKGMRKGLQTKGLLAHWILFDSRPDLSPL